MSRNLKYIGYYRRGRNLYIHSKEMSRPKNRSVEAICIGPRTVRVVNREESCDWLREYCTPITKEEYEMMKEL